MQKLSYSLGSRSLLDAVPFFTLTGATFFIAAGKITQQLFLRLLAYLQIDSTAGQWQW